MDGPMHRYHLLGVLLSALIFAGTPITAQNPLALVGLDESSARDFILKNLGNPSSQAENAYVITAYQKVPATARGPLTTQLYAWTKAHINSPAFQKAYAAWREENRPIEKKHEGTVEQEVKAKLSEMRAEGDASYKDLLAAGMKPQAEQMRKQFDASMAMMEPGIRREIEEARVKDAAEYASSLKFWQNYYPADPLVNVAKHLREYLENTADVDFSAKRVQRKNGIGELEWFFLNEPYNKKPWQWKVSYNYGPEGTAAGRTEAAAWLKQIGSHVK